MKIKGEKTYPARTVVEVVSRVCDLCGCETDDDREWPKKPNPGCSPHKVRRVEISMEIGDRFDGGGDVKETSFDVCPECFQDKLIPAMAALGAKPSVEDRGW